MTGRLEGAARPAPTVAELSVMGVSAEAADFAEVADFTFTIPAHATVPAAAFSLTPVDDSVVEPDETVSVGSTTRGVVVVPALVTIADDDDTTAPSLSGATVEGADLVLPFDEALDEASVPGTGAFSVLVEGAARAVDAVAVRGTRVTLTGDGIEVGSGLRYSDPRMGLTAEAKVRGLAADRDVDYTEWGASGSVRIEPDGSERGLSLSLSPTWGARRVMPRGCGRSPTRVGLRPTTS